MKQRILFIFLLFPFLAFAQNGRINGVVSDRNSQRPLPGITITLVPGGSTTSDTAGNFTFSTIAPGTYSVEAGGVGYAPMTLRNIVVTTGNVQTLSLELE